MATAQKKAIGRRIAELREAKGWTQGELAERIGDPKVDSQYVSKWERGVYTPQKHLEALAAALEVEQGDILAGARSGDAGAPGGDLFDELDERAGDRLTRIETKLDRLLAWAEGRTAKEIEDELGPGEGRTPLPGEAPAE